jgi:hypothetical protein
MWDWKWGSFNDVSVSLCMRLLLPDLRLGFSLFGVRGYLSLAVHLSVSNTLYSLLPPHNTAGSGGTILVRRYPLTFANVSGLHLHR